MSQVQLTTEQKEVARLALLEKCPIIGIYGETGTGKTHFCGSIMADTVYRKCLYIDADRGGATISHLTAQPDLCDYRTPDKAVDAYALQQWTLRQLQTAHKVSGIGSIVIEGVARIYEDSVGEQFADAPQEKLAGHHLRRLYIVPSGLTKAVLVAISNLQSMLVYADRSVPVVFTVNTKERSDDEGNSWQVPAISDSARQLAMGRSDAFVQLERRGSNVVIATDRNANTNARKVRHPGAAIAIAKLRNPTLPQMIQTWADAQEHASLNIKQHLENKP